MPIRETLILAVTRMHGGVCIAGVTSDPHPVTRLAWVRPVREFGHVLAGDVTTDGGRLIRPFDVVELSLLRARPDPPHTEDWIADFVRCRPRVVRSLEGDRRARFLERHLDTAPDEVLLGQQRSLCLVKPQWIKGSFRLDGYSGQFDARLAFGLGGRTFRGSYAKGGLAVTDLRWRALGRDRLPEAGGWTEFEAGDLQAQLGIEEVYLAVGLTRAHDGRFWPIVVGVHTVPDYEAEVDAGQV